VDGHRISDVVVGEALLIDQEVSPTPSLIFTRASDSANFGLALNSSKV